ncbi:hypothetical protein J7I86_18550, partial [Arthrobacter sp. ISL-95]|nr:hypothetical protein [Arthrobacter sp. ISL-95]
TPEMMRAIRLTGPVDIDNLIVRDVPIPEVRPGWVRIHVMAFGVNESEATSLVIERALAPVGLEGDGTSAWAR